MSRSLDFFDRPNERIWRSTPWWVWGAVIGSLLVCSAIFWIHYQQSIAISRTAQLVDGFRRARVDLAKGFLHVSLDSGATSPFNRDQGIALLKQATDEMRHAVITGDADHVIDQQEAHALEQFETADRHFSSVLNAFLEDQATGPEIETQLRLAFYDLERQADLIDGMNQRDLRELSRHLAGRLTLALAVAALMLGGICTIVYVASRQHTRFIREIETSEDRLQKVIESMAEGIVITSMDGRIMHWNRAAVAMHGLPMEFDLYGRLEDFLVIYTLITPQGEVVPFENWPLARLFRGEILENEEYLLSRNDAPWERIFSYNGGVVHETNGKALVYLAISDVSQARRAESALRESELRFRQLAESLPLLVWTSTPEGECDYLSPQWLRYTGVAEADQLGAGWINQLHPDDREPTMETWNTAVRGGRIFQIEFRLRRHDGEYGWFYTQAIPLRDEQGSIVRWFGSNTDITDRRAAEAALREEKERLTRVAATSPGAIHSFRLAPDGSISFPYASPRILDIYGIPLEELRKDATSIQNYWHPEDVADLWRSIETSRINMTPWHAEFRVLHPIKGLLWLEGHSTPVRDPDGGVTWHGSLTEITERKQLEEQLRQSQKMEAIGQLASGVAHDFNNLLTVIQGNASLLVEFGPREFAENSEAIIEASERATSLTRQLLLFSRRQVMQPTELNLNKVVGNMTRMLQRLLGEHIALQENLEEGLPLIRADAGMIEQVILNLAVNARDAMPAGGLLSLNTRKFAPQELDSQSPAQTAAVCLSIADNGTGIDPEILPRIFEPFFTTKEVGKGTGLGLATVYGIVNQHGGRIHVDSTVGVGTTFEIQWPVARTVDGRGSQGAVVVAMPHGRETILVVEDEPSVRKLVALQLERCGYRVLTAVSGKDALNVWSDQGGGIDLLLTDMVMPDGITGSELGARLAAQDPNLRVIYTSGYSPELAGKGIALIEGENFLQKPYLPGKLAEAVRTCLDRALD